MLYLDKPASMLKYAIVGTLLVYLFNIGASLFGKLSGTYSFVFAIVIGLVIAYWFSKSEGRLATDSERNLFLWTYGSGAGSFFLILLIIALSMGSVPFTGLLNTFISFLLYPAIASWLLKKSF